MWKSAERCKNVWKKRCPIAKRLWVFFSEFHLQESRNGIDMCGMLTDNWKSIWNGSKRIWAIRFFVTIDASAFRSEYRRMRVSKTCWIVNEFWLWKRKKWIGDVKWKWSYSLAFTCHLYVGCIWPIYNSWMHLTWPFFGCCVRVLSPGPGSIEWERIDYDECRSYYSV